MNNTSVYAETLSPVSLAERCCVTNNIRTLDYIPGTVWRAALAKEYIRRGWQDNREFALLFLNQAEIVFNDLQFEQSRPLPLTALTCKYSPGFALESDKKDAHGVYDLLIPKIRQKCFNMPLPSKLESCSVPGFCQDSPLERFSGRYKHDDTGVHRTIAPQKTWRGHTAIYEPLRAARENSLYSIEMLADGQKFYGSLCSPDAVQLPKLKQLLHDGVDLWIGGDRSRGLGRIMLISDTEEISAPDIAQHFKSFNENICTSYQRYLYFSITASSRIILIDEFMRYKTVPDVKDLIIYHPAFKTIWDNAEYIHAWVDYINVSGWNSAIQFPKAMEMTVIPGSVFAFRVNAAAVNQNQLIAALQALQERGIGLRRCEGFGQVSICDQFHWLEG